MCDGRRDFVRSKLAENSLRSDFLRAKATEKPHHVDGEQRGACLRGEKKAEAKKKKEEEEAKWSRGVTSGLLRIVTVPPACHSK